MALSTTQTAVLRRVFKAGNPFMVWMWKTGLFVNPSPSLMGKIMVLVHTGRKTGLIRYTPVNYAVVNDAVYCTAGFGSGSDWYKNIMANPNVEIWLPGERWKCSAEDITGSENDAWLMREVLIASGFAAPLFAGIHPKQMTDGDIRKATEGYRLIRLHKVEKIHGLFEVARYVPVMMGLVILGIVLRFRKRH